MPEITWTIEHDTYASAPCPIVGGHDRLNRFGRIGEPRCRWWCRVCKGFGFLDGGKGKFLLNRPAMYQVPDKPGIPQYLAEEYHANLRDYSYFESRGITKEWADKAMLGYCPQKMAWTIPLFYGGMLYGMQYRSARKDPKYRYWSEKGGFNNLLYGAKWVADAKFVVIVEGALDCIAMNGYGFPCVATPASNNANAWQTVWNDSFKNAIDKVIVSDYDHPGEFEAPGVVIALAKQAKIPGSRIVTLPLKDVGEMFKAGRQEELPALLKLPRRITHVV